MIVPDEGHGHPFTEVGVEPVGGRPFLFPQLDVEVLESQVRDQ